MAQEVKALRFECSRVTWRCVVAQVAGELDGGALTPTGDRHCWLGPQFKCIRQLLLRKGDLNTGFQLRQLPVLSLMVLHCGSLIPTRVPRAKPKTAICPPLPQYLKRASYHGEEWPTLKPDADPQKTQQIASSNKRTLFPEDLFCFSSCEGRACTPGVTVQLGAETWGLTQLGGLGLSGFHCCTTSTSLLYSQIL